MPDRDSLYSAFNFLVEIDGGDIQAGFSEVSGLGTEITVAEYRNGNDPENNVTKVADIHKQTDVTLKRGIINSQTLFDWVDLVRTKGGDAGR